MRTRVTNMSNPQTEPRRLPVFKLLFRDYRAADHLHSVPCRWLSRSELLYAYDTVETRGGHRQVTGSR